MSTASILILSLCATIFLMLCAWVLSLMRGKACVVDSFWGLGFVLIVWINYWLGQGAHFRSFLIAVLVTLWGLRLSIFLTARNWGKPEDRRYKAMRDFRGPGFWWISLFTVFLLQGSILWIISLVAQLAQLSPEPVNLTWLGWTGILIWMIGFTFEAVGDHQMRNFRKDPANKGKVMDRGLWGYTRHPNYFGETLIWWGLYLVALPTPYWKWALISPVLITLLLLKVSGVAMTEKDIHTRRPDYEKYKQRVSPFIPWFQSKNSK